MIAPLVTIRKERPGDELAIRSVHVSAFPTDLEARLVDQLRRAGRLAISLVAVVNDEIVAHLAFSPVTVENAAGGLGLAPVSVTPLLQKQGIGAALIRDGLAVC